MGFALFKIAEFDVDEISSFIAKIQVRSSDASKFSQFVELVAFQPFSSGREALEHMNNSSEGKFLSCLKCYVCLSNTQ